MVQTSTITKRSAFSSDDKNQLVEIVLEQVAKGNTSKQSLELAAAYLFKPIEKCTNVWNHLLKGDSLKGKFTEARKAAKSFLKPKSLHASGFVKNVTWTNEEDEAIYQIAKSSNRHNHLPQGTWIMLSESLGRTVFACQARWAVIKSKYNNRPVNNESVSNNTSVLPTNIISKKISDLTKHFQEIENSFNSLKEDNKVLNEKDKQNERTINRLNKELESIKSKKTVNEELIAQNTVLQEQLKAANIENSIIIKEHNTLKREFSQVKEDLDVLVKANAISRRLAKEEISDPSLFKRIEGELVKVKE